MFEVHLTWFPETVARWRHDGPKESWADVDTSSTRVRGEISSFPIQIPSLHTNDRYQAQHVKLIRA